MLVEPMHGVASDLPLAFAGVTVRAGGHDLLAAVSAILIAGRPTAILGPNGAGKSTLIRVAMGLQGADAGEVTWGGRRDAPARRRAIVFQRPVMLKRSTAANVAFALAAAGHRRAERHDLVGALLDRVGLGSLALRPARKLSGGEQQRLALARALARLPEILFLDEPTNNLDPAAAKAVEKIIADAAASGIKVVMATHDLGQARRLAGDVLFMVGGRLIEHTTAARFFTAPTTAEAAAFLRGDIVE
jgi:tungstate transport system ATP-binding protein